MIEVRALEVHHSGDITALAGIDLDLPPGQHVALMGANGSGKTSLVRCINGLLLPSSGSVTVDGLSTRQPQDLIQIRQQVGMVFQNPDDQLVTTSVETEIAFGLENNGVPSELMRQRVEEMLVAFSLDRYRHTPPHLLSGGERQRLAIAAAVALKPTYLLLDEPTALLDPVSRQELVLLIRQLCADEGVGILHVTQNAEETIHAHRLIVLHQGHLYRDGTPEEIFSDGLALEANTGIDLPFATRCALSVRHMRGPVALHVEDLDRALAAWQATDSLPPPPLPVPATQSRMQITQLHHVYNQGVPTPVQALADIEMEITAGEILAIAGASGSGKTTLVQHLNGLLRPSDGQLTLDGVDLADEKRLPSRTLRQRVGLVFQFPEAQLFAESVAEDVAFGPQNVGLDAVAIDEHVTRALEAVGLPIADYGHRSPFHLSGGERRRVAIAGVLAMDPQILVLDEPTAGLDAAATRTLMGILQSLRDEGRSIVLVSHDMDLIADLATRLVVLDAGRIAYDGPTRDAFDSPPFRDGAALIPPAAWRFSRLRQHRDSLAPTLLTTKEVKEYARTLIPSTSSDPQS
ncbi:MAG: ATP-binding cassette domain-containing protein [Gemmatimonadetes bacterium]|nr:ATP-binding cassette domain-containing protein [Gemmatimonadota bacterium]MBT7859664.1 ATP-binding cassette domain-containing protein [Gemmatimonadota bacterium]